IPPATRAARGRAPTPASSRASPSSRPPAGPAPRPTLRPPHFLLAFPAASLFSSSWRLLGSGPVDRLVLADPILRPTRAPPLLSSQVQQREGHPPVSDGFAEPNVGNTAGPTT